MNRGEGRSRDAQTMESVVSVSGRDARMGGAIWDQCNTQVKVKVVLGVRRLLVFPEVLRSDHIPLNTNNYLKYLSKYQYLYQSHAFHSIAILTNERKNSS